MGSVSCSDTGNICAAVGKDAKEQYLSGCSPDGKKVLGITLKTSAKTVFFDLK